MDARAIRQYPGKRIVNQFRWQYMGRVLCHFGHHPSVEQFNRVVFRDDSRPNHFFVLRPSKAADRQRRECSPVEKRRWRDRLTLPCDFLWLRKPPGGHFSVALAANCHSNSEIRALAHIFHPSGADIHVCLEKSSHFGRQEVCPTVFVQSHLTPSSSTLKAGAITPERCTLMHSGWGSSIGRHCRSLRVLILLLDSLRWPADSPLTSRGRADGGWDVCVLHSVFLWSTAT